MKVIIFGVGKFYQKRKKELLSDENIKIIAALDNNREIQGSFIDGIPVFSVEEIETLETDIVLLMSIHAGEMKKQLLKHGIGMEKIWYWERFKSVKEKGIFHFYCGNPAIDSKGKKILILTSELGYHGGSMAVVYAAKALKKRGYNVILAASKGSTAFVKEMENNGLNILICPALPYLYEEELFLVEQFDIVMVNVFPMILCAYEISKRKPVVWWIHEAKNFYVDSLEQFNEWKDDHKWEKLDIYAVSKIAQNNFNRYFPNWIERTLAYGIPDEWEKPSEERKDGHLIFSIIGGIMPRKAQDIFMKAVKDLPAEVKKKVSFWIIGMVGQDSYSQKIRNLASQEPSVMLLGEMTRAEIRKIYRKIDVLVCPSEEDPLPIVVTEAMMYGKICIVSDSVGTADYITDGENGFIFETGNVKQLAEKMKWVMEHRNDWHDIGQRARRIYEQYFTMEKFADRLEEAIENAMESYPKNPQKYEERE